MTPRLRKLVLSVHLTFSVGWIGAVAAYLSFDIATGTSRESATLRAWYLAMELVVRYVIVPLALGALLSGVAISLGTRWGLFRHYWVLISLLLTHPRHPCSHIGDTYGQPSGAFGRRPQHNFGRA